MGMAGKDEATMAWELLRSLDDQLRHHVRVRQHDDMAGSHLDGCRLDPLDLISLELRRDHLVVRHNLEGKKPCARLPV